MPSTTRAAVRLVVAGGAALIAVALVAASAPDPRHASTTLTAAAVPSSINDSAMRRAIDAEVDAEAKAEAQRQWYAAVKAQDDARKADQARRAAAYAAKAKADRSRRHAAISARPTAPSEPRETIQDNSIGDDVWRRLANCEASRGQDSANGSYHGFFQFSLATWHSVGESGDPHTYSYEHQQAAAQRLQSRSGWGQWPKCSRTIGVR